MEAMHQILICLFLVMAIVYTVAQPDDSTLNLFSKSPGSTEKYGERFDRFDIDKILKNERLFINYYKCLLDEQICTADGNEIKSVLPEALATECLKCTEKQKENISKLIYFMIMNRAKLWEKLTNKYDPENEYKSKYEEQVKKLAAGAN